MPPSPTANELPRTPPAEEAPTGKQAQALKPLQEENFHNQQQQQQQQQHPSYDSSAPQYIIAVDPATRKLCIPMASVEPTMALSIDRERAPSLCMLHHQQRCRQGPNCHQLHADPSVVEALRQEALQRPACCASHGDEASADLLKGPEITGIPPHVLGFHVDVARFVVDLKSVAMTVGAQKLLYQNPTTSHAAELNKGYIPVARKEVCRLHILGKCRYAEDCNFVHICRSFAETHQELLYVPQKNTNHHHHHHHGGSSPYPSRHHSNSTPNQQEVPSTPPMDRSPQHTHQNHYNHHASSGSGYRSHGASPVSSSSANAIIHGRSPQKPFGGHFSASTNSMPHSPNSNNNFGDSGNFGPNGMPPPPQYNHQQHMPPSPVIGGSFGHFPEAGASASSHQTPPISPLMQGYQPMQGQPNNTLIFAGTPPAHPASDPMAGRSGRSTPYTHDPYTWSCLPSAAVKGASGLGEETPPPKPDEAW